jgi:XTP/dITP diphosphohydrolase
MKLIFATNNNHKLSELRDILGSGFDISTPADRGITEDIPEDEPTLEGNALQKARYVWERTGVSCFADDTGLEVAALDGAPGVLSARYAGEAKDSEANMELLLANLKGQADRTARFRTVIALIMDGNEYLFEGEVRGHITTGKAGHDGFGYDPVFRPSGYSQTFAQMDASLKNSFSHRARAAARLAEFLRENGKLESGE